MYKSDCLIPNIDNGRFFVSPVLGCTGACSYCYLAIKNFGSPRKNKLTESDLSFIANQSSNFVWGQHGTIISIGAWGDIFPRNNDMLVTHSVRIINYLLSWGNPVQIMSKNSLCKNFVNEIIKAVRYPGQLLYSTTITSIDNWMNFEPGTSDPLERLKTCYMFHKAGCPTNVLIKPFIPKITDLEIEKIANLLLNHQIDYCTLGIMYLNSKISEKIQKNAFLRNKLSLDRFSLSNHLDCNGKHPLISTEIDTLIPYVKYLRMKGISTFLKSSCVTSNVLQIANPSNYYNSKNKYCIHCGNCKYNNKEYEKI